MRTGQEHAHSNRAGPLDLLHGCLPSTPPPSPGMTEALTSHAIQRQFQNEGTAKNVAGKTHSRLDVHQDNRCGSRTWVDLRGVAALMQSDRRAVGYAELNGRKTRSAVQGRLASTNLHGSKKRTTRREA